jgi:hypothetical protein
MDDDRGTVATPPSRLASLTTARIVFDPPVLPRWYWWIRILQHPVRTESWASPMTAAVGFPLAKITLVRPTLSMFQVAHEGWTAHRVQDAFPWNTLTPQEAQSDFFDALVATWEAARTRAASPDTQP